MDGETEQSDDAQLSLGTTISSVNEFIVIGSPLNDEGGTTPFPHTYTRARIFPSSNKNADPNSDMTEIAAAGWKASYFRFNLLAVGGCLHHRCKQAVTNGILN